MKIGFLGNMNNAAFSTARYLIDKGYDCEVLSYNDEPEHFSPEQDSFNNDHERFARKLGWGDPAGFLELKNSVIEDDIKNFDFIIGNGPAPAAMKKIGRRLNVFTPYGYDLYSLPFFKMVHPLRIPAYWKTAVLQRRGIAETPYIIFDKTNDAFEKQIDKLSYTGNRLVTALPMVYWKEYSEGNVLKFQHLHPQFNLLQKLRKENDFIFLQHIRQVWKTNTDKWALKGNDFLLKGYQRFLKRNPSVKTKLLLFEYGIDVKASKQLIKDLGIDNQVIWLPKLPRKYVMISLHYADLIIGELKNSWLTYGAVAEALCIGKPFMHKRIDEEFKDEYEELYPMIYADSAESVCQGFEKFIRREYDNTSLQKKAQQWFNEYVVEKPLAGLSAIIK